MKQNYRLKRDSFKASLPVICTGIQSKKCKYKFNETDASLRKRPRLWSLERNLIQPKRTCRKLQSLIYHIPSAVRVQAASYLFRSRIYLI